MAKKIGIITGASGGIGEAISRRLGKNHTDLILTYYGNDGKIAQLKRELEREEDVTIHPYKLNVAKEDEINELFNMVKTEFGQVDTLVNNAGITNDMLVTKMSIKDFTRVIDTNLTGTFLMSKLALKLMARSKEGTIINISSVIGLNGNAGQANYAASKAGVIALTKSLAKEYGRRNIRINAVAPGFIASPMTDVLPVEYKMQVKENIAMRRFGSCEEVANTVNFLASDQSTYITGQTIVIDGFMG